MTLSAVRYRRFAISTVLVIAVVLSACTDGAGVDREALVALYAATDGASWTINTNWLSDKPVGEWYGVTADRDGHVVELDLEGNYLIGELPSELGDLGKLNFLNLRINAISGEIPSELGDLSQLKSLVLGWNDLSGKIPSELGDLSNLETMYLYGNNLKRRDSIGVGRTQQLRKTESLQERIERWHPVGTGRPQQLAVTGSR